MNSCTYCGEAAVALDHVIPRLFESPANRGARSGQEPGFTVPSCTQCNSILGSRIFNNLVERKEFVHHRLKVKLQKHNATVGWSDAEIKALGRNLRSKIEVAMAKREVARDRLRYSAGPPEARWLAMEERWRAKMGEDETLPSSQLRTVG